LLYVEAADRGCIPMRWLNTAFICDEIVGLKPQVSTGSDISLSQKTKITAATASHQNMG